MFEALDKLTNGNGPLAMVVAIALVALVLARLLRRIRPALERSSVGPRIAKYIATAAQGWVLTLLVLFVMWAVALRDGRSFAESLSDIGLNVRLPAPVVAEWTVAMIIAITAVSYAIARLRKYFGGKPTPAGLDIIPETPAETAVFSLLVAPTAGLGEEIVFRGFVMGQLWYLMDNAWEAAAVSSLVFGLLHLYQGWWGVFRISLIGMIFAVPVVVTGSLIPSILAHTLGNMLSATRRKPVVPQPV